MKLTTRKGHCFNQTPKQATTDSLIHSKNEASILVFGQQQLTLTQENQKLSNTHKTINKFDESKELKTKPQSEGEGTEGERERPTAHKGKGGEKTRLRSHHRVANQTSRCGVRTDRRLRKEEWLGVGGLQVSEERLRKKEKGRRRSGGENVETRREFQWGAVV